MPSCCVVPFCASRDAGHRFPKDKHLKKKWLIAIRRNNYEPSKFSRICKRHFAASDYVLPKDSIRENPIPVLRSGAVPSIFLWMKTTSSADIERSERVRRRLNLKESVSCFQVQKSTNLCEEVVESEINDTIESEVIVEEAVKEVGVQCGNMTQTFDVSTNTNDDLPKAFGIECFRHVSKQSELKFYTGFDDYSHFWFVFSLLGPAVNNLLYYSNNLKKKPQNETSGHRMTPADEFLLTMIKLRRNMAFKELAFKFNITEVRATQIFITWINFLYCQLRELDIWVPRKTAEKNMKIKGKNCSSTVIIDCTEIKIEKPTNPVAQQLTYSSYKSCNTLKVLIGMSTTGCVTFISDAYGGSISDRILFEKCGIINLLQKNDIVLADKGFQIQDLVAHMDVIVNIPEFVNKDVGQLEHLQLIQSKKISSQRIHIERIIGMAKTYKIIKGTLTTNLVPLASRIIFTCFMLVNLRPSIMETC